MADAKRAKVTERGEGKEEREISRLESSVMRRAVMLVKG